MLQNYLTSVQEEFLKILNCFMHEKEYHFPDDFSGLMELYQLASVHKVTAVVYEQIRQETIVLQKENEGLLKVLKKSTIMNVMLQAQREAGFLQLYKKLLEQGIKPVVVKGIICRNLYAKSDYRVSGDEDLLIRKEEFELCDKILLEEGMQREEIDMNNLPCEIPYRHPKNGVYIELHFKLFSEESGAYGYLNQEFEKVFETAIIEKIQDIKIWTLDPTLHMFYLICHSFKHFLHSGVGIRQVCDMVMMADYYKEQIDWSYMYDRLKGLRLDGFWNGLVEIGKRYLGFIPNDVGYPEALLMYDLDCSNLLQDLLDSGVFGQSTAERKHSANVTLAAVKNGKKNVMASINASLFPNFDYMKKGYPWLQRYPFLLPVAWGLRILNYIKNSKKNGEKSSSLEIGMDRVELLKEYHIID
ncbi:MAG: nucleotidyltransferase family protein [Schaedlerella sp.]|nr:nucleotidyltransferase family protein [Schaedlerella sp.]